MKCAFHDNISLDNYTKLSAKDRLIHEHLFVESVSFCLSCLTCGESYCKRCGILIENQPCPTNLTLRSHTTSGVVTFQTHYFELR
jgi:hypothetical protein